MGRRSALLSSRGLGSATGPGKSPLRGNPRSQDIDRNSSSSKSAADSTRHGLHERSGFGFSSPRFVESSPEPGQKWALWGKTDQTAQVSWSPSHKPKISTTSSGAKLRSVSRSSGDAENNTGHIFTCERSRHLVQESFEARLARSVDRHMARKSYQAQKQHDKLGTPGNTLSLKTQLSRSS